MSGNSGFSSFHLNPPHNALKSLVLRPRKPTFFSFRETDLCKNTSKASFQTQPKSMEWIERLNCAVNYMEEHLCDEIDTEELSMIACCSTYHFQRMFAYMAEVPLSEYIRLRRMARAKRKDRRGDILCGLFLGKSIRFSDFFCETPRF